MATWSTSCRGAVRVRVRAEVSKAANPGTVFMTFHYAETRTKILVGDARDEFSGCPEYKVGAVRIEKVPADVAGDLRHADGLGRRPRTRDYDGRGTPGLASARGCAAPRSSVPSGAGPMARPHGLLPTATRVMTASVCVSTTAISPEGPLAL
jgi:hypothetical protein